MPKRGRPSVDNLELIVRIKNDPVKTKDLNARLQNAVHYLREQEYSAVAYKDVIADAAEAYGLAKGFIGKLAKAIHKGDAMEQLEIVEAIVELVGDKSGVVKESSVDLDAEIDYSIPEDITPEDITGDVAFTATNVATEATEPKEKKRRGRPKKEKPAPVLEEEIYESNFMQSVVDTVESVSTPSFDDETF